MSKIKSLYMYDRIADITTFWGYNDIFGKLNTKQKEGYYNYDN